MAIPIIGDLIQSTVGNVVNKLTDHYLPASMSDAEKAEFKLKAQELTTEEVKETGKRIESVNATMRAEAKSEHWWTSGWRPYWGFVSGTAFLFVCLLVCVLAYQAVLGGHPEAMAMIPQVIGAFAALFAIPGAILGVTAWHRGKMQRGR
jgi:hypothetical protein